MRLGVRQETSNVLIMKRRKGRELRYKKVCFAHVTPTLHHLLPVHFCSYYQVQEQAQDVAVTLYTNRFKEQLLVRLETRHKVQKIRQGTTSQCFMS